MSELNNNKMRLSKKIEENKTRRSRFKNAQRVFRYEGGSSSSTICSSMHVRVAFVSACTLALAVLVSLQLTEPNRAFLLLTMMVVIFIDRYYWRWFLLTCCLT